METRTTISHGRPRYSQATTGYTDGKGKRNRKIVKDDPLFGCDRFDVRICELVEQNPGITDTKIGQDPLVRMCRESVNGRLNSDRWKALYYSRHVPAKDLLRRLRPIAMEVMGALLATHNLPVRLRAAERILGNLLDAEKGDGGGQAGRLTAEQILDALRKAQRKRPH